MHLIYVNGVAEKTVEPNMVLIHLESWAKAPTATAAQEQQALQFGKVKSSLEKFKIKKEDIQTQGFSVYPEYTYDQKAQLNKISGYRVSHSVLLTYRKTEDAGTLLDSLVTSKGEISGVNIQSVSWDYDKKAEVETATLGDAVKNARSKAEDLAKAADVIIKAVHKIQHTSYAPPVAQPMYERAAMKSMDAGVAAPTELSSGQIKVRVEVQMEFEI
ncbi:SIMPL domain-containing protein [bacterium]|nr:SIMPL domain-containing protein [bacterium]